MTCEEALERISAALDGELSGRERRELDAHLDQCPACDALFDELAGQSRLLRELDCEVPEDLTGRILARLPRWRATPHFWQWACAAAVCLVLALCLGVAVRAVTGWGTQAASMEGDLSGQADELGSPEPFALDNLEKSAGLDMAGSEDMRAQYLSGVGPGDLSGRYIGSAAELDALLAEYDRGTLASALGYDGDYFACASLLAVFCQGSETGMRPVVTEVRTVTGGYRVSLEYARGDGGGTVQDAWLILVEIEGTAEDGSGSSVEVVADG